MPAAIASQPRRLPIQGTDEISFFEKKMQPTAGGQAADMSVLLVRLGDRVCEITWHNQPVDVGWAQRVCAMLAAK